MENDSTLESLERELADSLGKEIDTELPDEVLNQLRANHRRQYVMEFRAFKEAMEISKAIGDDELAAKQKEAATKALKAIAEIDRRSLRSS
jgi:FKBP-type peptidyl-prolyl cis-trans isomerase (trigger factor)